MSTHADANRVLASLPSCAIIGQGMGELVALLKAGYSGQIILGNDVFSKVQTRRFGGTGYRHLVEWVVPTLRDLGVSAYDIRQMTVENPARLLAVG